MTMAKARSVRRRQFFFGGVLSLVAATWAYATVDNYRMRQSLEAASEDQVFSFTDGLGAKTGIETATAIIASRQYVLFGETTGKVTVFFKTPRPGGDAEYRDIEITYERQGSEWIMTGSYSCHAGECKARALQAFQEKT